MNRKWVFLGCGGLLLLGFLIAGCTAIVAVVGGGESGGSGGAGSPSSSGEGSSDEGSSGDASSGSGEAAAEAVPVGEPLDVGEVSWVVNSAEQVQSLQSQFGEMGEDREGSFVVVDFTFTNNGAEAVTLDTVSMTLVDGQGRSFEADPDAFEYIEESRNIFLEQVNPGVGREGTAIFTVAPDAQDFTLELGDAAMFSDQSGAVQLDF